MTHSMHCDRAKQTPNHASGYTLRNGAMSREPDVVHTATYAAGAICSTAGDMITWLQSLHGGKVLSPKSYAEVQMSPTLFTYAAEASVNAGPWTMIAGGKVTKVKERAFVEHA